MQVETATLDDVKHILQWLLAEYKQDHFGFWSNRGIIERAQTEGELWVIRIDGYPVAFQVGHYSADIVSIRQDHKRRGLGTALFKASLKRAYRDDVNVLSGECEPRTSLPFWQRQGFIRYGNMGEYDNVTVYQVLQRELAIPQGISNVEVKVEFFTEAALYKKDVKPFTKYHLNGAMLEHNTVALDRRAIGPRLLGGNDEDVAVKINIDGKVIYLGKAKYDDAQNFGIKDDYHGNAFYIDSIKLT
jgi:GNAT superfamily N-acetyltransferase